MPTPSTSFSNLSVTLPIPLIFKHHHTVQFYNCCEPLAQNPQLETQQTIMPSKQVWRPIFTSGSTCSIKNAMIRNFTAPALTFRMGSDETKVIIASLSKPNTNCPFGLFISEHTFSTNQPHQQRYPSRDQQPKPSE